MVEHLHHGAVEGIFLSFIGGPLFGIGRIDAELLAVFVEERLAARMDRRVDEPRRVVKEERLGLVGLHELQRVNGHGVGGETLCIEAVGIAGLVGGKALEAVAHALRDSAATCGEIKPLVQRTRKARMGSRHVPLSGVSGGVAVFAKRSGDRLLIRWHAPAEPRRDHPLVFIRPGRSAAGDMGGLCAGRIVAAHDCASARRAAGRGGIRVAEENAALGESVHIRSLHR